MNAQSNTRLSNLPQPTLSGLLPLRLRARPRWPGVLP
jgi:hypothetical protein